MTRKEAARMIDISAVRTHHNIEDIKALVEIAEKYRFINVHVLPAWTKDLSEMLKNDEDILVGSPVGFPSGGHTTDIKLHEAQKLLEDGVQEIDIVMNIGKLKCGDYDYVLNELKTIINMVNHRIPTKVIIEINTLTDEEMLKAADIVIEAGADYVKTGTGWVPGTANIERIRLLKKHCGNRIKIKAAGGIRTVEDFQAFVDMGVERLGINTKSALEIVESLPE